MTTKKALPYRLQRRAVPWRWVIKGTGRWADRLARESDSCNDLPARNPAELADLDWVNDLTLDHSWLGEYPHVGVLVFDAEGVQVVSNEDLTNFELLLHAENALTPNEDEHRHLTGIGATSSAGEGTYAVIQRGGAE